MERTYNALAPKPELEQAKENDHPLNKAASPPSLPPPPLQLTAGKASHHFDRVVQRQEDDEKPKNSQKIKQNGPRVFADFSEDSPDSLLKEKAMEKAKPGETVSKDFSYKDMALALYGALAQLKAIDEESAEAKANAAIQSGASKPLVPRTERTYKHKDGYDRKAMDFEGSAEMDSELDLDLQLIPYLMRHFQGAQTRHRKQKETETFNPFVDQEDQNASDWMGLPKEEGLEQALPESLLEGGPSKLSEIFPGFLDVSLPANGKETSYEGRSRVVFKLFKEMQYMAFKQSQEEGTEAGEASSEGNFRPNKVRRAQTDAFMGAIKGQKDSAVGGDPNAYSQKNLGIQKTEDEDSVEMAAIDALDFQDAPQESDSHEVANQKRNTLLNALALAAKMTNRKILEDRHAIQESEKDSEMRGQAEAALKKHLEVQERLNQVHEMMESKYMGRFKGIAKEEGKRKRAEKEAKAMEPEK